MTTLAAVTGRFQPFHCGHVELLSLALAEADRVVVGITNPDPGSWREHSDSAHRHRPEANPFTLYERIGMIDDVLTEWGVEDRCTVVGFPLDRPEVWGHYIPLEAIQYVRVFTDWERSKVTMLESGGYTVRVVEGDPAKAVRATSIRSAWLEGRLEDVDHLVPVPVSRTLARYASHR